MAELLIVFPKLHFNCCICSMENISFVSIGCCQCESNICKNCIENEIDDKIVDYRDCCDFYIPNDVNMRDHFHNVVENSTTCNECINTAQQNYWNHADEVDYSDYSDDEMFL